MSEPTPDPVEPTEPVTEPTEPTTEPEPVEPTEPAEGDEEPAQVEQPGEPAPSPAEPQSGVSVEEWDKRVSKAEQRFGTYERAIFGIFEEAAHDLIDCPMCLGAARGFIDKNMLGHFPEEQVAVIKQVLGITAEKQYKQLPGFATCGDCDGEGKGLSGSNDPQHRLKPCPTCKGRGYRGPATEVVPQNGHVEPTPTVAQELGLENIAHPDDVDEWNEPRLLPDGRDNPNFGRMPHRKILVDPWGTTAGLTAQDAVTT